MSEVLTRACADACCPPWPRPWLRGIDLDTELAQLATGGEAEDGVELAGQEVEPASGRKKKKKSRSRKEKGTGGSDDDDDDDSGSGSDYDSDSDSDDAGDDAGDDTGDGAAEAKTKTTAAAAEKKKKPAAKAAPASASQQAGRQVYVTPIEARALLKKLWGQEYDFCSMVYPIP